jgi:hypothetical protein
MIWESLLFMLAFEASFCAVQGSAHLSHTAVVNYHALCVSCVVAAGISLPQLLRRQ